MWQYRGTNPRSIRLWVQMKIKENKSVNKRDIKSSKQMKNLHTCSCNPLKDWAWWRSVQISWLGPQGNHVLLGNPYGSVPLCLRTRKQKWTEELLLGGLFLHAHVLEPNRGVQPLRKALRFAMWSEAPCSWTDTSELDLSYGLRPMHNHINTMITNLVTYEATKVSLSISTIQVLGSMMIILGMMVA
jgi:hypothetical protein